MSGKSNVNSIEVQLKELLTVFPLPWSAYVRLLTVKNVHAREFYETEALIDHLENFLLELGDD